MLPHGYRNNYRTALQISPIPIQVSGKTPVARFEEEEGSSYDVPTSFSEFLNWWEKFSSSHNYPLYCMLIATEADKDVALLVENNRVELQSISGQECCFVYFRDLKKAKMLGGFHFEEHVRGVEQLIRIIDLKSDELPCLLFFEDLASGDYVLVDLQGKNEMDLVMYMRELFSYIYAQDAVSLSAVKAFKFSKHLDVTKSAITKNLREFSVEMVRALIKSLVNVN